MREPLVYSYAVLLLNSSLTPLLSLGVGSDSQTASICSSRLIEYALSFMLVQFLRHAIEEILPLLYPAWNLLFQSLDTPGYGTVMI